MASFLYLPSFRWSETAVEEVEGDRVVDIRVPLDPGDLADEHLDILRSRMERAFAVDEVAFVRDEFGARFAFAGLGLSVPGRYGVMAFKRDATQLLEGLHADALAGWTTGDEIERTFRQSPERRTGF